MRDAKKLELRRARAYDGRSEKDGIKDGSRYDEADNAKIDLRVMNKTMQPNKTGSK